MIKEIPHYYLVCDNCQSVFYDKYGENAFKSDEVLMYKAKNKGWVGEADEPLYNAHYHFCSMQCRERYIENIHNEQ